MPEPSPSLDYPNRSWILKIAGATLLLIGLAAAAIVPLEIGTFYAFADGGRFHYDGFGFGSFMFAYIAIQVAGYAVIAGLGIGLGLGTWHGKRWVLALSEALVGVWLLAGLPLTLLAAFMLITSKALTLPQMVIAGLAFLLIYPVGPLVLGWTLRRSSIRRAFEADPAPESWLEALPLPLRVLGLLLLLSIVLLHFPLLTNGIYPWFGMLLTGQAGIAALDATILLLGVLVWGVTRRDQWAWWVLLVASGVSVVSSGLTFSRHTTGTLLQAMSFPPTEMAWFDGLPFLGWQPAIAGLLPPLITLTFVAYTRRFFVRRSGD